MSRVLIFNQNKHKASMADEFLPLCLDLSSPEANQEFKDFIRDENNIFIQNVNIFFMSSKFFKNIQELFKQNLFQFPEKDYFDTLFEILSQSTVHLFPKQKIVVHTSLIEIIISYGNISNHDNQIHFNKPMFYQWLSNFDDDIISFLYSFFFYFFQFEQEIPESHRNFETKFPKVYFNSWFKERNYLFKLTELIKKVPRKFPKSSLIRELEKKLPFPFLSLNSEKNDNLDLQQQFPETLLQLIQLNEDNQNNIKISSYVLHKIPPEIVESNLFVMDCDFMFSQKDNYEKCGNIFLLAKHHVSSFYSINNSNFFNDFDSLENNFIIEAISRMIDRRIMLAFDQYDSIHYSYSNDEMVHPLINQIIEDLVSDGIKILSLKQSSLDIEESKIDKDKLTTSIDKVTRIAFCYSAFSKVKNSFDSKTHKDLKAHKDLNSFKYLIKLRSITYHLFIILSYLTPFNQIALYLSQQQLEQSSPTISEIYDIVYNFEEPTINNIINLILNEKLTDGKELEYLKSSLKEKKNYPFFSEFIQLFH